MAILTALNAGFSFLLELHILYLFHCFILLLLLGFLGSVMLECEKRLDQVNVGFICFYRLDSQSGVYVTLIIFTSRRKIV